jgi:hypothetical protein
MLDLFNGNVNYSGMHNRESLDDLIYDLEQYRRTLPTIEEYSLIPPLCQTTLI